MPPPLAQEGPASHGVAIQVSASLLPRLLSANARLLHGSRGRDQERNLDTTGQLGRLRSASS